MRKIFTLAAACAIASASAFAAIDADLVYGLEIPNSLECSKNTVNIYGYHGMGVIALNLKSATADIDRKATAPITLDLDGKTIGSIAPSNEGQLQVMAAGMFAEGDDPGTSSLYILFDLGFTGDPDATFQQTGNYTLTIPEGTIKESGVPVGKYVVTYHYSNDETVKEYEWVTKPADGATVKDLNQITVSFPGCNILTYAGNGTQITLTRPDGSTLKAKSYPSLSETTAEIYLEFNEPVWKEGTYTLTIPKGVLNVDNLYWDEETEPGNVQEITAKYNVVLSTAAEITTADSENTIYTIQGLRVDTKDIDALPAGLYIINGKKIIVK